MILNVVRLSISLRLSPQPRRNVCLTSFGKPAHLARTPYCVQPESGNSLSLPNPIVMNQSYAKTPKHRPTLPANRWLALCRPHLEERLCQRHNARHATSIGPCCPVAGSPRIRPPFARCARCSGAGKRGGTAAAAGGSAGGGAAATAQEGTPGQTDGQLIKERHKKRTRGDLHKKSPPHDTIP